MEIGMQLADVYQHVTNGLKELKQAENALVGKLSEQKPQYVDGECHCSTFSGIPREINLDENNDREKELGKRISIPPAMNAFSCFHQELSCLACFLCNGIRIGKTNKRQDR